MKALAKRTKNICSVVPYTETPILSIQEVKQKAGWSITALNLPEEWKYTQGEGVTIAVIDSGCDLTHEDLKDNLLEGRNFINPREQPIDRTNHGCISSDCLIHTNHCGMEQIEKFYDSILISPAYDGKSWIKDIKNLEIQTYSLNANSGDAEISTISHLHKTLISDEIIKIKLEGNIEYKLTKWHPIYLLVNTAHHKKKIIKKRADELVVGDRLLYSYGNNAGHLIKEKQIISGVKYYECENCSHIPTNLKFKSPKSICKKCRKFAWVEKTRKYLLNEDLAYIIGIVLSDGHIVGKNNYFRVEVSSKTVEILIKVKKCLEKLGFHSTLDEKTNRTICYLRDLAILLNNIGIPFGKKTSIETIPKVITQSPLNIIHAFLGGLIDGDGCISQDNTKNRIITSSKILANQLTALLNSIGITTGIQYNKEKRVNHKINGRICKTLNKEGTLHVSFASLPKEIAKHLAFPEKKRRALNKQNKNKRYSRRIRSITKEIVNEYFYDFTVENNNNYLANGHFVSNTHVTGIICAQNNDLGVVGVAPKAKVIPIKALDDQGNGAIEPIAQAIRYAADRKVDFIVMSLGCPRPVPAIHTAIKYAAQKGIVCFIAAGNAGITPEIFYPAAYPETIAIGAIDKDFRRAQFSCTGKNLDFMCPGVDILSTIPNNWYSLMSGSSMAAPFACGIAALLLSYSRSHNNKIKLTCMNDYREIFRQCSIPLKNGAINAFMQGFGMVDPRKLMDYLKTI